MNWLKRSPDDRLVPGPGGHERSGAWTIDRAVRALATGCAARQRRVPAVGAVVLRPESVLLMLTTPDETPPPGWTAGEHGRTWQLPMRDVTGAVVDDRIPDPFPLLVSLGVTDGDRILLNLAGAGGVVSLEGDTGLARSLLRSWARRLTNGPWATGARVVRVGFPPDPDFPGLDVPRLTEAAPVLPGSAGGVLLFAGPPTGRDLDLVGRLLAEPVRRWSVAAVGAQDATWRFSIAMDGTVDTGILADPVRLRL